MELSNMENYLRESIETYVAKHCMVPDDQQLKQQQTKYKKGNTVRSEEKLKEHINQWIKSQI